MTQTNRSSSDSAQGKIDVGHLVERIEQVLRAGRDAASCQEGLAILRRWQWDQMLDQDSRLRARALLSEFDKLPTAV